MSILQLIRNTTIPINSIFNYSITKKNKILGVSEIFSENSLSIISNSFLYHNEACLEDETEKYSRSFLSKTSSKNNYMFLIQTFGLRFQYNDTSFFNFFYTNKNKLLSFLNFKKQHYFFFFNKKLLLMTKMSFKKGVSHLLKAEYFFFNKKTKTSFYYIYSINKFLPVKLSKSVFIRYMSRKRIKKQFRVCYKVFKISNYFNKKKTMYVYPLKKKVNKNYLTSFPENLYIFLNLFANEPNIKITSKIELLDFFFEYHHLYKELDNSKKSNFWTLLVDLDIFFSKKTKKSNYLRSFKYRIVEKKGSLPKKALILLNFLKPLKRTKKPKRTTSRFALTYCGPGPDYSGPGSTGNYCGPYPDADCDAPDAECDAPDAECDASDADDDAPNVR
jgi:hypothetical protein